MKTIKLKDLDNIPEYYTGIVEWKCGNKAWHKNGKLHKEDGPTYIGKDGYKAWYLNGKYIWDSESKLDLTNQIILSKSQHPEYPTVHVWKILDSGRVYERIVIPGMEEHITE